MWAPRDGNNKTEFSEKQGFARLLALTSPHPFIFLAPVQQVAAGFCYIFYHYEQSFHKVGENPLESSRNIGIFRKTGEKCHAKDLLPCMGARGRAVEWHSQGSLSTAPKRGFQRNQKAASHLLHWPSLELPYTKMLFLSSYLYIFRGPCVEKKKGTKSRFHLPVVIVTCWFWKPRDKVFTEQFSSLSLTRSSCPEREASSELKTDSLAFCINPIRSDSEYPPQHPGQDSNNNFCPVRLPASNPVRSGTLSFIMNWSI